jgi:hypothetical protein
MEARITPDRTAKGQADQPNPIAEPGQQAVFGKEADPEAPRLVARANELLVQRNIGAAQALLEHAVEAPARRECLTSDRSKESG